METNPLCVGVWNREQNQLSVMGDLTDKSALQCEGLYGSLKSICLKAERTNKRKVHEISI